MKKGISKAPGEAAQMSRFRTGTAQTSGNGKARPTGKDTSKGELTRKNNGKGLKDTPSSTHFRKAPEKLFGRDKI